MLMGKPQNIELIKKNLARSGIFVSIVVPLIGYILYGIALGSVGYSILAGIFYTFMLYSPFLFSSSVLPLSIISYLLGSLSLYKAYRHGRKIAVLPVTLSCSMIVFYAINIFLNLLSIHLVTLILVGLYELGNLSQLLIWRDNTNVKRVRVRVYGLPKGLRWSIIIDGRKYYFFTNSATVNITNNKHCMFYVENIIEGSDIYIPKPDSGIISNNLLEIYFIKTTNIPNIDNWNPKIWVGRKINDYEVIDVIALGGSSFVLKVKKEGNLYAMKIPKINKSNRGETRVNAHNLILNLGKEFVNLQEISYKSQNVVKLFAISEINVDNIIKIEKGDSYLYLTKPPYIVMELMDGGNAFDILKMVKKDKDWYKVVALIVKNVAKALEIIHSSNYVHLDVKPQNIYFSKFPGKTDREILMNLISGKVLVKLGDLGSARRIGERIEDFTEFYCPIEQIEAVILKNQGASPSMDIFALGATAYKLLFDEYVYPKDYYDAIGKAIEEYEKGGNYLNYLRIAKRYMYLPKISNLPMWFSNLLYEMFLQKTNARSIYITIERNLY
ncbi:protein kinase [Sulfolobus tengchongensis]|uniref:Protein kinase n=1 Tax=Sulfolobus tengchongensis TaxID=207809 RepID=A0AAX4L5B8_9CREN